MQSEIWINSMDCWGKYKAKCKANAKICKGNIGKYKGNAKDSSGKDKTKYKGSAKDFWGIYKTEYKGNDKGSFSKLQNRNTKEMLRMLEEIQGI